METSTASPATLSSPIAKPAPCTQEQLLSSAIHATKDFSSAGKVAPAAQEPSPTAIDAPMLSHALSALQDTSWSQELATTPAAISQSPTATHVPQQTLQFA